MTGDSELGVLEEGGNGLQGALMSKEDTQSPAMQSCEKSSVPRESQASIRLRGQWEQSQEREQKGVLLLKDLEFLRTQGRA